MQVWMLMTARRTRHLVLHLLAQLHQLGSVALERLNVLLHSLQFLLHISIRKAAAAQVMAGCWVRSG